MGQPYSFLFFWSLEYLQSFVQGYSSVLGWIYPRSGPEFTMPAANESQISSSSQVVFLFNPVDIQIIFQQQRMHNRQFLINISNLPPEQKKHCTDLLTNHDIVFDQDNEEGYTARIVIDPSIKRPVYSRVRQADPRKNIADTVSMESFGSLIPLMKTVEVYVCPKKLPVEKLQVELQLILDSFFRLNDVQTMITYNLKGSQSFPLFFFDHLSKSQQSKVRFQQLYVNLLESINHFKNKSKGVKVFQLFLSDVYSLEELLFFYFLRKMIQTLKSIRLVVKNKVKTNLYHVTMDEEQVVTILDSYLAGNCQEVLDEIKNHMRYEAKTKKNIIGGYQLVFILLQNFNKRQNAQEVREQLIRSLNSSMGREEMQVDDDSATSKFQFGPSQNLILLGCLETLKKICEKAKLSVKFYDDFSQLVVALLSSVFTGDKMSWFQKLNLQPTPSRLQYIECLQQDYVQYQAVHHNSLLLNRIVSRAMQAPGMQQSYARAVLSSR